MIHIMNLIISWLISVGISAAIGYFYAKGKYQGRKKTLTNEKNPPTAEEIWQREKKLREERNFWNYDGTEQNDSNV